MARDRQFRVGIPGATTGTWQVACTVSANPTSTSNVTITGFSQAVTVPSTGAVYMVTINADWSIVSAGSIGIIELLVDGVAQAAQMVLAGSAGVTIRGPYSNMWRITGLSVGSHTFTARTRNTAAATSTLVTATNSTMVVERAA